MHYDPYDYYAEPRGRWVDWAVGILLGVALGVAVVAAFVFLGSENTIDAPSIQGVDTGLPAQEAQPIAPREGPR